MRGLSALWSPQLLAHIPSWSSPAPAAPWHATLYWPSADISLLLNRSRCSCWEVLDSWHIAIHTNSAAVCLLNYPALRQTAREADGNQLHPEQDCAIHVSQGVTKLLKKSGCTCTQTKLITSMFPDLSFRVISFSRVLGALIASWDELRLLF